VFVIVYRVWALPFRVKGPPVLIVDGAVTPTAVDRSARVYCVAAKTGNREGPLEGQLTGR